MKGFGGGGGGRVGRKEGLSEGRRGGGRDGEGFVVNTLKQLTPRVFTCKVII